MPPPRQDVDVTKVFRFNGIRNFVLNLIAKKLENKQLKLTDVKKSFIQRFRGSEVRTSGCLRRAETANKLLSCEAPITACLPGFLTSGSHYSLTSAHMNFRSSHNQSVGKASIIQTYGLPCNDWNNIHSLEESANELRAKQRREGGGVAVQVFASEQERGSKGVGESKPSPQPSPIGEGAFRHSEEASNSTRQIEFCINFSRHSEALRAERIQPIMVDGGQEVRRSGWYNKRTLTNYTNIVLNENSLPSCPLNFRSSDNQPFTLHHSLKRNAAFTLAEVLITLGIIGVVAALTLPSIISKYKKQVIATRLEQFASIYQQAIRMAEIEHGETIYWEGFEPYNADAMLASYNKYLGKYINTIDVYKTAKGVAFELSNGSGFHLHKTMNGQAWRGYLYVGFCVHYKNCKNIEEKGSASYDGKETFHFTEIGTPIRGFNGKILTRDELLEDCKTRHYTCSGLIQHDGWKISDDYPIRI